ncbi:MAG: YegP family protein [Chitinophagales bacterium]|nr:YegP family protein [Chitinophagales bacterium]
MLNLQGTDLKYYFSLQAANGEKIGKSEGYNSAYGRDKGKENCKQEAPYAQVKEVAGNY